MALNNTTADAVATALCTAIGVVDAPSIAIWKTIIRNIYSGLKTDIDIIIQANAINTVGGPAAQAGPPAPVSINPA